MAESTRKQIVKDAFAKRREGQTNEAKRLANAAISACQAAADQPTLIEALKLAAALERDQGNLEEAQRLYEDVVAICVGAAPPIVLAHTLRHLGDIHLDRGTIAIALSCQRHAMAIYRGLSDEVPSLELANAHRSLALSLDATSNRDAAATHWLTARTLYAAANIHAGVAECNEHLSPQDENRMP